MSDTIFLALDSVRRNKLRSFLTVLGVVIGVATVIGMSSIINGLNGNVSAQIEELGSNLIFVSRFPPTTNGRLPPEIINRKRLTLEDAQAIAGLPLVKAVAPILRYFAFSTNSNAFTVRYRDRTAKNTIIEGVTPEQETVMNLQLSAGRWINEADDRHNALVVVWTRHSRNDLSCQCESGGQGSGNRRQCVPGGRGDGKAEGRSLARKQSE